MELSDSTILVTGGTGFIGEHLAERLVDEAQEVRAIDKRPPDNPLNSVEYVTGDVANAQSLQQVLTEDVDVVIHLAASKHVNTDTPRQQFESNLNMTYELLEQMDDVGVQHIAFTSSSTVYGEAETPTEETYTPLEPTSPYGASKIAAEGLLSTYAHTHGFTVWNFRLANIVGPRLCGAVIPDFISKLQENSDTLTILGDGRQEKSYMHISDCIDGICHILSTTDAPMNTFNLGTDSTTSVTQIADIVSDEMGVKPDYEYTGGERGWDGDIPRMCLSIERLEENGFKPKYSSDEAVRKATQELLET